MQSQPFYLVILTKKESLSCCTLYVQVDVDIATHVYVYDDGPDRRCVSIEFSVFSHNPEHLEQIHKGI